MANLLAIGLDIINLDRVSVLDVDPIPGRQDYVMLRVLTDSSQPIFQATVATKSIQEFVNTLPTRLTGFDLNPNG